MNQINQIVECATLLFCDRANGEADVTVPIAVPVAAAEAEVAREVAAALVQRSRPVVAGRATIVEVRTEAVARSGQKDAVTVRACYLMTLMTALSRLCPSTFITQLFKISKSRHTPTATPLDTSDII